MQNDFMMRVHVPSESLHNINSRIIISTFSTRKRLNVIAFIRS